MSIDQRQFEQLSEMGIKLWQRRTTSKQVGAAELNQHPYQKINIDTLTGNQCFNDILQAFNLTLGEINLHSDHLDLGLINWYFIDAKHNDEVKITYLNNKLITPTINLISQSVKLKKQLWQTISQQQT
jgi:hypothetical protein